MPKNNTKKIILTGGHASTTAIATVEELIRTGGKFEIELFWVGPEHAIEGKFTPTLAATTMPKMGVTFHSITAGRFQRKFTGRSLIAFLKFPLGFLQAIKIIKKVNPDVILSFGGYAAFPIVVVGKILGIPIMLHDQTYSFNRSNKFSAPFADKIAVSRKASLKYYPSKKTVITGNPVMSQILEIEPKKQIGTPPTIFVMGGSSGAQAINKLIEEILPELLQGYSLIHLTGHIDYQKFKKLHSVLNSAQKKNYELYASVDPMQIDRIYKRADIVVSRSGANTVSELLVAKRPAILIPLTIGNWKEQLINARYAERFGIAKVLLQDDITSVDLINEINLVRKNWSRIVSGVGSKKSPDINAAKNVTYELHKIIVQKT